MKKIKKFIPELVLLLNALSMFEYAYISRLFPDGTLMNDFLFHSCGFGLTVFTFMFWTDTLESMHKELKEGKTTSVYIYVLFCVQPIIFIAVFGIVMLIAYIRKINTETI